MDWNHQKMPYLSMPPVVHPFSIPSMVTDAGSENIGKAQIVSEFAKPFKLIGLLGAANAGTFGDGRTTEEIDVAGVVAVPGGCDMIVDEATATWVPQKRG